MTKLNSANSNGSNSVQLKQQDVERQTSGTVHESEPNGSAKEALQVAPLPPPLVNEHQTGSGSSTSDLKCVNGDAACDTSDDEHINKIDLVNG